MKILLAAVFVSLALAASAALPRAALKRKKAKKAVAAPVVDARLCKKCGLHVVETWLLRRNVCVRCSPPSDMLKEAPKPVVIDPRTSGTAR